MCELSKLSQDAYELDTTNTPFSHMRTQRPERLVRPPRTRGQEIKICLVGEILELFFFQGKLLYNVVLVSAVQQREWAVSKTYISSLLSLPPTHSLPHIITEHRTELPVSSSSCLFYTWQCVCVSAILNSSRLLPPPLCPQVHQTRIFNHSTTAASWSCGGDKGPQCLRGRRAEEGSTPVLHECWAGF